MGKVRLKNCKNVLSVMVKVLVAFCLNARDDVSAMVLSLPGMEVHSSGLACRCRMRSDRALSRNPAILDFEVASLFVQATVGVLSE